MISVGYDCATQTLEIQFQHGGTYMYRNVPLSVFDGLMAASSKGSFFHENINDHY